MKKKITTVLMFLLLLFGFSSFSQEVEVSGTVTSSEDGLPMPGVSVVVIGTTTGTATDFDGNYTLTTELGQELQFTFMGYIPQVHAVAGTTLDIVMQPDAKALEEVVVTGYTVRKKEVNTSSVAVVGGEELGGMAPITSVDNMLQGKATGVDAVSMNGKPGATATVKVRGAVSLNTTGGDKAQPTYVIDGAYVDETDINMLNPNDIESMTVLKDASAAALYGSRGANGVIVIKTKQGKKGEGKISYTGRYGFTNKIEDRFEMMNASEKIAYEEAAYGFTYTDEEKEEMLSYEHNWQDEILKQGTMQSHAVTAVGGNEKSNYFMSLGYDNNTGIVNKLDGFERISARVNTSSKVKEKLEVGANIGVSYSNSNEPRDRYNVQNPFNAMYGYNPYTPVYKHDDNGDVVLDDNGDPIYNLTAFGFPILEALENNPENESNTKILGSVYVKFDIIEGFSFMTKYAGNYDRYKREYFVMPGSVLDGYVGDPTAPGSKSDSGSDTYEYNWLSQLTYVKSFGLSNVDASVFTEYNKGLWHFYRLDSKGYASDLLTTQDNSAEATRATTSKEEWAMFSVAALFNYDYDGKYLLGASIRRDGASRFGSDTRFGTFYSVSAGWNIANESFMESASSVDVLKLTVSYGTLGNWSIPNYASRGYYSFDKYNRQSAAIINKIVSNPELTWEKQKSANIGVEGAFFGRRLNANVDYFSNTRTDFLFATPMSYEGGGYSKFSNTGEMRTNGLEISLNGDVVKTNDFTWNLSFNMTALDYEIKSLDQEQIVVSGISVLKEGEEPFTFYLPRYVGVDSDNGDALYLDKNGEETNVFSSGDAVIIEGKSPLAKIYGGFGTYINFRGIDLGADFSFKTGNYIYNYVARDLISDGENAYMNQRKDAMDYWKEIGDNKLPRLNGNSNQTSDRFLQDGSYLRFRSVTLGYSLPADWVSKAKLSKVRFFVQGQNLLTWTKFEGDPEVSVGSGENQLEPTQDFVPGLFALYSYPAVRSWMFGVDINF